MSKNFQPKAPAVAREEWKARSMNVTMTITTGAICFGKEEEGEDLYRARYNTRKILFYRKLYNPDAIHHVGLIPFSGRGEYRSIKCIPPLPNRDPWQIIIIT